MRPFAILLLLAGCRGVPDPPAFPDEQLRYHTAPAWTRPEMKSQHDHTIPSCLLFDDGHRKVARAEDWRLGRRPELLRHWTRILGKLEPAAADLRWFGDITRATVYDTREEEGYTRIHLGLPMETDFLQHHLLLLPKGQGPGPFPAVIAWSSSTPDYAKPEEWWGAWLARRGFIVLTSWSFIRHYRDGTTSKTGAPDRLYERFGRWLPMGKMVHDIRREADFLKSRPDVDGRRLGFIGFSLGAKAALYAAAFLPELAATVSVDPHVSLHGATNWEAPWFLDWRRPFEDIRTPDYPVAELRNTVWSLLDADPNRPGFERNHHELLALCAPRPFLLIGCNMHRRTATHSDDLQSRGYVNRAREVYGLLGVPDRLQFFETDEGHRATSPRMDPEWQRFFTTWLKDRPPEPASFPFDGAAARKLQQDAAAALGKPVDFNARSGHRFLLIPPGTFLMGSPPDEPGRKPDELRHDVTLTQPFYLGRCEVTVGQFRRFVEATGHVTEVEKSGGGNAHTAAAVWKHAPGTSWRNPGYIGPFTGGDDHPVVHVSHVDARAYCRWLEETAPEPGWTYGLPSEAEWEWACRAGSGSRFWWGSDGDASGRVANAGDRSLQRALPSWPRGTMPMDDGHPFAAPVGSYRPNAFGLHDMLGNVWEFCATRHGAYPAGASTDPGDLGDRESYDVRGGGWSNAPADVRCAARNSDPPRFGHSNLGFRLALHRR